ncbi:MAG: hybrid sensor histidine kinase/response regulator [Pseudomonadota bacterium]
MNEERISQSPTDEEPMSLRRLRLDNEPTQTIDLGTVFTKDLTASGSYDVKGGIWASTFGKLIQSLPIPAFMVDEYHEIMVANQACGRIYPDYEHVQSRPFSDLFPDPAEGEKAAELLGSVLLTRTPQTMDGGLRIGGGRIWARLTFRSIRIIDIRLVLVLVENLTYEKKLLRLSKKYQQDLVKRVEERTAELKEVNAKLLEEMAERKRAEEILLRSERLRALGEMSAGVAHNFKNLIQVLFGLAHTALKQLDAERVREAGKEIRNIIQTLQHSGETIGRLQDFAKLGTGASQLRKSLFDLSDLVSEAVEFTRPFWHTYPQSKGVTVNLAVDLTKGCFVDANRGQVFDVLVNLVKNAAEAVVSGGSIYLKTYREDGEVFCEVEDTGIGIREEDMSRIFTPFFTTKSESGTGLGLATSRSIIENHEGAITVTSTCGRGSIFSVTLPFASERPITAAPIEQVSLDRKLTVLAVDDLASALMVVKFGLEAYHHSVLTATSGEDALRIVKSKPVDLVLCDLAMPGMNGWDVGRSIRDHYASQGLRRPLFIMLTAWARQSVDKTKMAESGVDAVLEKPVDIDGVIAAMADLMRGR